MVTNETIVGRRMKLRYAGWVGTIAAKSDTDKSTERLKLEESSHRLAACAGTSTCHIVQVSPFRPGRARYTRD